MPTYLTEDRHAGGYVVFEDGIPHICREEIVVASGAGKLMAGTVLGKIGHVLVGVASAQGANTGNPTFGAITVGAIGNHEVPFDFIVRMQDATRYVVEDPAGEQIGHGVLGSAFNAGGLSFTFTAGGTPAVPGDTWKINVAVGSGKYVPYDPTGNDGRERAAAILFDGRDATAADKKAVAHVRGPMRITASELIWGAGVTTLQHKTDGLAALKALGIQAT